MLQFFSDETDFDAGAPGAVACGSHSGGVVDTLDGLFEKVEGQFDAAIEVFLFFFVCFIARHWARGGVSGAMFHVFFASLRLKVKLKMWKCEMWWSKAFAEVVVFVFLCVFVCAWLCVVCYLRSSYFWLLFYESSRRKLGWRFTAGLKFW